MIKDKRLSVILFLGLALFILAGCGKEETFISDKVVIPSIHNGEASVIDKYETSTPDYYYSTDADGNMSQVYAGETYDYYISYQFPDGIRDSKWVPFSKYRLTSIGDTILASHRAVHAITYKDKHGKINRYRSFKAIPKDIKKGDKYRAWIHM